MIKLCRHRLTWGAAKQGPGVEVAGVTCGYVLNPVGVRANSGELPVGDVGLVALLDCWLVDGSKNIYHVQVCVVVAEEVPTSIQSTLQARAKSQQLMMKVRAYDTLFMTIFNLCTGKLAKRFSRPCDTNNARYYRSTP